MRAALRTSLWMTAAMAVLVLAFSSCKAKQESLAENQVESHKDTIVVVVKEKPQPQDSLLISFEKTPCFGTCPVYKIRVYRSGFATYEGINFAERLGLYSTRFTEREISRVFELAEAADYLKFDREYDDRLVTDLPSTISVLVIDGVKYRVKARHREPENVKMFHDTLAELLTGKDWEPYSEH